MEDSRQTRGTIMSWTLIGVAFIAIIVALFFKFISDGTANAKSQSQDRLIANVMAWSGEIDMAAAEAEEIALVMADSLKKSGGLVDESVLALAKSVTENTDLTHVLFGKSGKLVCDEQGISLVKTDITHYLSDESYTTFTDEAPYDKCPAIVAYVPINGNKDFVICITELSEVSKHFETTTYDDVSFLALMDNNGNPLCVFSHFSDTDSMFLRAKNILNAVSIGTNDDGYNLFRVKLYNGTNCAIESTYQGDARTVCFSRIGKRDCYAAYGVRQSFVNKITKTNFANVKGTVVKLVIVIFVFAIFVTSTIVFNSLRTKERGRVLEDKADTDLLTELNNKAATERKIQEYMAENPNGRGMMFILDIDNFKKINDTMGHAFGDTLLKTLGKEIRTEFRMTDIVGRTGGDEFMVFLKDVTDDLIIEREANRITRFFHDFKAGGDYVKYSASASIGAAIFPDDAKTFKDLYVAADQALYKAKKRGKNQLVFYNEEDRK